MFIDYNFAIKWHFSPFVCYHTTDPKALILNAGLHSFPIHYSDVIMGAMASQITSLKIIFSTVYSGKSKKSSKLPATGICTGNSPVTGEFPAQRARNTENVSIWWRHHGKSELLIVWTDWLYPYPRECVRHRWAPETTIRFPERQWHNLIDMGGWITCIRGVLRDKNETQRNSKHVLRDILYNTAIILGMGSANQTTLHCNVVCHWRSSYP